MVRGIAYISLCWAAALGAISRENVPIPNPQAQEILPFFIAKDFSNGALTTACLQRVRNAFGIEIFIESGAFQGHTAAAAGVIFPRVHTIEVYPPFYERAVQRFHGVEHVHVHFGDSGVVLRAILGECTEPVFYYLDGHFDGGVSGKGERNTPILQELEAISKWGHPESVILIDDICDFQKSCYPERIINTCFEGYPTLEELVEVLLKINDTYQFAFWGNALLAFPPRDQVTVSPVLGACALDRFSTLFTESELMNAEKTIARAEGQEREELKRYCEVYSEFEWSHGWRSYSAFWYALMLQESKSGKQAAKLMAQTRRNSLPGWRADKTEIFQLR